MQLLQAGDYAGAVGKLEAAAASEPATARLHTSLGVALLQSGRPEEAQRSLERALSLDPKQPAALFNLGVIAADSGDARAAASWLERAWAAEPRNAATLVNLVSAYLRSGQAVAALQKADRLLALPSADAALYGEMGDLLAKAGHVSHAAEFYRRGRQVESGMTPSASARFDKLLAEADAQIRRDQEAIAQLERSLKAAPNEAAHYFRLGLMLTKLGQFKRAFELIGPAVRKFPQSPEIRLGYALACYFTGQNEEAEKAYLQLARMQPGVDQPHFALGNFYSDVGRLDEASAAFRRAVARNRANYLNHYMLGVTLFRQQLYKEAAAALQAAARRNPAHADSQFWLGKIRVIEDDPAQAIVFFERAAKLEPKHVGAYYQLALLYARAGQKQKSQEALEVQRQLNAQLHKGIVALRMP